MSIESDSRKREQVTALSKVREYIGKVDSGDTWSFDLSGWGLSFADIEKLLYGMRYSRIHKGLDGDTYTKKYHNTVGTVIVLSVDIDSFNLEMVVDKA